ncbi:asialoglycoprotein receptor 1-like isoform X2 [Trachinotus anak]|uniref:asialoglycoprotein receptor 1-like isoform X2 n=1 Tax=Trachinotus anak TaxID=443729 RepID=UPI0039F1EC92
MAEEDEVNYASVVFKAKKNPQFEAQKQEETVYDEVKVQSQPSEQTADTNGLIPDKKANKRRHHCQQLACFLGILCIVLIIGIIVVWIYLVPDSHSSKSELDQLKDNQTTLLAENRNLTDLNNKLVSENENLRRNLSEFTVKFGNLTQTSAALESNITNLTAQNQELATQNQELKTQKQELESERNNLKQQIHNMTTERTELNVTRAQWTIDTYCPIKEDRRQCEACEDGWLHNESSCYAVNNPTDPNDWRNWTEAREDCRGKISDLVVIVDEKAKTFVSGKSWESSGNKGYWIGLRVEDGRWKWVDGSDLTESSWIKPPEEGRCAISVQGEGWKSVSCSERNRWVCGKAALSV